MKATKKLAALFLAMVMVLSLSAVTAAAYGETGHTHDEACSAETIQPRKPTGRCIVCGAYVTYFTKVNQDGKITYYYDCGHEYTPGGSN